MANQFSSLSEKELLTQLSSSFENGLSDTDAHSRLLKQAGAVKIESRFKNDARLLLRQFTNPLVVLLIVAVIFSAVLGEITDMVIILFIVVATGLLSFWQELNAGRAVEQLQKMISLKSDVLRNGKEVSIPADSIVPGDIILLNAGDIIPADCRILESNELQVNESTITGETFPVMKKIGSLPDETRLAEKTNSLWQGTNVVSGTGKALVVNTGSTTIFGGMAHSLRTIQETAFETGIKHFGYFLMQITIVLSIVILSINIYFHRPLLESVLFALAIAVGMAPELLPAILTFAMSAGAKRMLKKKVIVKKLSSIFNFGEVNILCTDKTGTLTEGILNVKSITDSFGKNSDRVKVLAGINSGLQNGFTNPIDDAVKGLSIDISSYKKAGEIPYDFIRKRLTVAAANSNEKIIVTKGAVDNVLEVCATVLTDSGVQPIDKAKINEFYTAQCLSGLRLIGVCYKPFTTDTLSKDDEKEMIFAGFIILEDPLKEGILDTLNRLKVLNVKVKIITGDNHFVAIHVAKQTGVENPVVITGAELEKMSPEALVVRALTTDIFAEVEPHQKERIIRALQKSKLVVAYMGDGINDVAAIHAADTGISTSNAVDVAKQAADFVLLEKDLSVLADGVNEGRKTFVNSLKYILINSGATFGNMFSVAGASLLLPFLPMLPKQILLTNFITDFPYLTVSTDNVDDEQIKSPGNWNMKLIRRFMIVFGLHSSIFDFITFYVLYYIMKLKDTGFQTGWFIESVMTELFILFIVRTRRSFVKSKPGKALLISSAIAFVITLLLPVSPFAKDLGLAYENLYEGLALAGIIIMYVFTADILKRYFFKRAINQ